MGCSASRRWKSQNFFYRIGKDAMSRRIGSAEAAVKRLTVEYTSTSLFTPLLLLCLTHKTRENFFGFVSSATRFRFITNIIAFRTHWGSLHPSRETHFPYHSLRTQKGSTARDYCGASQRQGLLFVGCHHRVWISLPHLLPFVIVFIFVLFLIKLCVYSFTMKH